jgi:hypothetical protein
MTAKLAAVLGPPQHRRIHLCKARICDQKGRHFHTLTISFSAAHVKQWSRRLKVRHDLDMAGEIFHMPSGSKTLLARRPPFVSLQPAQTESVAIVRSGKSKEGATEA